MGIIIRQSIKGTLVNYVGVAIGFITTFFVITHYLTQEEVGLTRVLVDAAVLFSSLAQIGTASSIIRFFPYFRDDERQHHGFFFWTVAMPVIGFLIFLTVFLCFKHPIVSLFAEKSPLFVHYFRFVIPLSLFMLYQSVFESNCNVLMRIVVPKFVREVGTRIGLLVSYLLYGWHIINLNGLVFGFCITYLAAVLVDIGYLFSLQKISLKPDLKFITKPLARDFIFYSLLLTATAFAANAPLLSSFFLSAKLGLEYTGIFAIANYIATVIEIPNRSLNAIAGPNLASVVKENDWQRSQQLCKNVSLHLLLSSTFIFLFIWMNIDAMFMILSNGESYVLGKTVVLILGMARILNSTFSILGNAIGFSRYYYFSMILTSLLTVMVIVFNLLLIPALGMNGSALASLAAYIVYFLFMILLVKWKLHITVFALPQFKVVVLALTIFALNFVWKRLLTQPLIKHIDYALIPALAESAVRSLVLMGLGVLTVYKWNISKEVNQLIDKLLMKVRRNNR